MSDLQPSSDARRWTKLRRLFDDVLAVEPGLRDDYLRRAADDDAMYAAVRDLVSVHDAFTGSDGTLGDANIANAFGGVLREAELARDQVIDGFRIERLLGEGGMGRVYLAQRHVAGVVQRVALKIVPFAVRERRTIERLRHERAILATLDHPNIARLIDAGELPDERPYYAMEYVDGIAITRYCDERALDLRARLALFADVCDAVAYAHRRLVLHRDLKPSNILVDRDGRVRLVDFGIAKSLEGIAANGEATVDGFFSVSSAAPEQVLGRASSVATDVYGLGCTLYELVAGSPPFRFTDAARETIVETIAHRPASPASDSASTNDGAARARQLPNGAALAIALRGDLDAIVARTLRKEPNDRYRSVDDLATDVRNVLAFRPIASRTSEWRYRFACFVRRHRVTALVAALLGIAVLATTAVSIAQYRRASVERDRAVQALAASRRVTSFLVDAFEAADPVKARGRELRADELLASAVASLENQAPSQDPALRATIAQTLAHLFFALDRLPESVRHAEIARAALAQVADPSAELRARQGLADAEAAFVQNRFGDAVAASTAAIERLGDGMRVDDGELLYDLWTIRGRANAGADARTEAERVYDAAIDLLSRRGDLPVEYVDRLRQRHATLISDNGKFAEAKALLADLLHEQQSRAGLDPAIQIETMRQLGVAYGRLFDYEQAAPYVIEAYNRHATIYGTDNAAAARLMSTMASLYMSLGRAAEALQLRARAIDVGLRRIGPTSPFIANLYDRMSTDYYYTLHDAERAEQMSYKALAATPPESLGNRGLLLQSFGEQLIAQGRRFEAEPITTEANRLVTSIYGEGADVGFVRADLAYIHFRKYDFDAARQLLAPFVIERASKLKKDNPWHVGRIAQMEEMKTFFGL
ncbi:serine/threonine protein kinase [Tahibacter soli]|uniref:Serine/threonine-protein kinase n=1 Tax=Tahibacter soli TaxID=2983605 RepID=A0A9X4BG53_9GAMM|nr:serine/threonine-protein kinase [Tahibacter soli]MDC8011051.1 serine/threonine-protein kinase [Tahibacter soli]